MICAHVKILAIFSQAQLSKTSFNFFQHKVVIENLKTEVQEVKTCGIVFLNIFLFRKLVQLWMQESKEQ